MAEVTAFRNNALPYPVYGVPWTIVFPLLDADGDPVTGATCDSEVSLNGDTGADCTNEGAEIPFTTATNKGQYYLTLTGAEMTADIVTVSIYSATSKATVIVLYPRKLVSLATGTSQGGAAGYITLAAGTLAYNAQYNGCLCVAVIDTLTEARILQACTSSNQQCTVTPNWNVAPDADDTYTIYLPEGRQVTLADITAWNGVSAPANTGDAYARLGAPAGASVSADVAAVKGDSAAILADTGTDGVVVAAASKTGYALSAAGVQAIWDALTSALTTVGSIGKKLADWVVGTIDTYTGNTKQTGDAYARLGAPAGASVSADIAAIPTSAEIDTQLSGTHGAGSWEGGGAAPTVGEIDTQLSATHGDGSWEDRKHVGI